MLAYAANRPDPAGRRSSPNVMLFIVAVHVAAIAALMSAKVDISGIIRNRPILVTLYPEPPPPDANPTHPARQTPQPQPTNPMVSHPQPVVPTPSNDPQPFNLGDASADTGPIGPTVIPDPVPLPLPPTPLPVRIGAQLLTPASQLRPPYPASKLANEEEADLRLRLSIGADGRVTSVEPIGRADAVFLDAARRYLIAHWRYTPASVDGRAVATTMTISLSFRLDA